MKSKTLPLIVLTFLFSTSISAQDSEYIGVQLGAGTIVDFNKQYYQNSVVAPGIAFGVNYQKEFTKHWSVYVAGMYLDKTYADRITLSDETGNVLGIGTNYLKQKVVNLPILARFQTGKNKWNFFAQGGPDIGFLMQAINYYKGPKNDLFTTVNQTKSLNRLAFGATIGLGTTYTLTENLKLSAEIRNNTELKPHTTFWSDTPNYIHVLFGLQYNLSRK